MFKVNRQNEPKEHYEVMQDWLILFAHEFGKQAYLDNLKPAIYRKQFNSIDEKMADIKKRIGFDVISKFTDEIEDLSKKSDIKDCNCNGDCCNKKSAKSQHSEEDIKKMSVILSYINDMVKAEPDTNASVVIMRCKNTDELGFSSLKIDENKLRNYINDLLSELSNNSYSNLKYKKVEPDSISAAISAEQADYYNHARPNTY